MKKIISIALLAIVCMAQKPDTQQCLFKGKPLKGRILVVQSYQNYDIRVLKVQEHQNYDLKVTTKQSYQSINKCGDWQFVEEHQTYDLRVLFVSESENYDIRVFLEN